MTGKWKVLITKDVRRLCVVNQQKWDRIGTGEDCHYEEADLSSLRVLL